MAVLRCKIANTRKKRARKNGVHIDFDIDAEATKWLGAYTHIHNQNLSTIHPTHFKHTLATQTHTHIEFAVDEF